MSGAHSATDDLPAPPPVFLLRQHENEIARAQKTVASGLADMTKAQTEATRANEDVAAARAVVADATRALDAKLSRLRGEQKKMASSGRKTRAKAEREILANADVVLATTVGAGAENIQKLPAFDVLVLDEAAQATEPAAWIPLVRCARAVLVGDPRQLAPIVRSEEARVRRRRTQHTLAKEASSTASCDSRAATAARGGT